MPQSTITLMAPRAPWESKYGRMFPFYLELADGTKGEANSKADQPWFHPGSEVDYEISGQSPQGTNRLKIKKPQNAPEGPQTTQGVSGHTPAPKRPVQGHGTPITGSSKPSANDYAANQALSRHGQRDGACLRLGCDLAAQKLGATAIGTADFWHEVWQIASDARRVAALLEKDKLAPNVNRPADPRNDPDDMGDPDFNPDPY